MSVNYKYSSCRCDSRRRSIPHFLSGTEQEQSAPFIPETSHRSTRVSSSVIWNPSWRTSRSETNRHSVLENRKYIQVYVTKRIQPVILWLRQPTPGHSTLVRANHSDQGLWSYSTTRTCWPTCSYRGVSLIQLLFSHSNCTSIYSATLLFIVAYKPIYLRLRKSNVSHYRENQFGHGLWRTRTSPVARVM